jgi:hypothetical protein
MTKTVRILVMPDNSTVNGRPAVAHHDAREWFDGWKNLAFDARVYKDGTDLENGPWEYLHVPLLDDKEERWYRVRCRYAKNFRQCRYKGHLVNSVCAELHGGDWFWSLKVEDKRTKF